MKISGTRAMLSGPVVLGGENIPQGILDYRGSTVVGWSGMVCCT